MGSAIPAFEKDCWKLLERTIWVKPYCPFAMPCFSKIEWMLNFKGHRDSIMDNVVHGVQINGQYGSIGQYGLVQKHIWKIRNTTKRLVRFLLRRCLCDNWKSSFLPLLVFDWCTFSRWVTACWWCPWAKNQVLNNQNSRNRWRQIVC